jgi:RecA-family ATPase
MQSPKDKIIEAVVAAGFEHDEITGRCQCPAHGGEGFNLAINESDTGAVIMHCHSRGCTASAVCQAIGVAESTMFPPEGYEHVSTKPKVRYYATLDEAIRASRLTHNLAEVGCWDYCDERGQLAGRVLRLDDGRGGKTFRQYSRFPDGWACKAMPGKRPLYNLPRILSEDVVIVCEGEKAADAVNASGLVATTSSQGSKSADRSNWNVLAGKQVWIVPDNDDAGRKYASDVETLLPSSCTIRVYDTSSLIAGGDLADVEGSIQDFLKAAPYVEQAATEEHRDRFSGRTVSELWELSTQDVDWYVEETFAKGQPTVFGARQKSLKTTLLSDLVVALADASKWLDLMEISEQKRVVFLTGESSGRGAMKRIRLAMESRDLKPEDLGDRLRIETVDFPSISSKEDLDAISGIVEKYKTEVLVLDPLYMAMAGINTSNVFEVGFALRNLKQCCRDSCELILSHHLKKSANYEDVPDLSDLSQAGIAEFAGNYWLMGRLSKYAGDGQHELAVALGGRDDQFARWHLAFDEHKWEAKLTDLREWQAANRDAEEMEKKADEELKIEHRKNLIIEYASTVDSFSSNRYDKSGKSRDLLDQMVASGQLEAFQDGRFTKYRLSGE